MATADHAASFVDALSKQGIDVSRARANGTLISFDADEALSRFLVDDWPNADAFASEVGNVIRRLVGAGRGVRVFGEMVSVLWDAGHVGAAIELETMWNDLGRDVSFSLFCAYPARSVAGDDDDSFQRVCHCHSAVIGGVSDTSVANPPVAVARPEEQRSFSGEPSAQRNSSICRHDADVGRAPRVTAPIPGLCLVPAACPSRRAPAQAPC